MNDQIKQVTKMFYDNPTQELAVELNTLEDLKNNKPRIFEQEERFDEQFISDKLLVHKNSDFFKEIEKFSKLDDMLNIKSIDDLEEREIPNKTLLSFLHDFYNSIDRELAKYFNRVYKERKNNLRITASDAEGYNRNYMYYLNTINYAYINIHLDSTIDDFINIIHEYAHVIAEQMHFRHRYGKYPFIELLPLLMQEIACDELIRCFEDFEEDVIKSDICTTKTVLKWAKELILQSDYLSIVNSVPERRQFINSFAEYANNTKAKTEKIINTSIQEKLSYVIPFILMIELYDMYYEDPEKCMYLTKRIITMDEVENYVTYLKALGINLNENSEDYVSCQKKILKLTQNV